jgi:hypothetical protein
MVAPWVQLPDLPTPLPNLPGGEAEWGATIALASEVLWALSGRRWSGAATRTVEVVAPSAGAADLPPGWTPSWGMVAHPVLREGEVYNCRCAQPERVRLPGTPQAVTEVRVGATTRPPSSYWLDGAYLVDLSGRGWPTCPPGMVVTYTSGKLPPEGGRRAAALLAWELGRARVDDPACGLPANVTNLTRQGISQTFVPASQIVALGQTGLMPVDTWLATVNPAKLTRRARAWSPDTAPTTRRITS